jgi:HTH-type transcriptional regulator, sugar sensing transcriptional regulator
MHVDAAKEGGKQEMNGALGDVMPIVFSAQSAHGGTPRGNGAEQMIQMLNDFGFNEKEARLYVHLLKYGPKRAGELARSLKTYRLDVYRKLASLLDSNMVNVKKESPAVYSAVDLDKALNNVILARQRELHWMEKRKIELLERVNGTQLSPHDDTLLPETRAIDEDRALIKLLTTFWLNEKEARLYVHLLKYGPKRAGELARSLKTYREDVYRRCARLIAIGVATKTSEDSSRYVPVELDGALNNVIFAHKRELRRLQKVKQKVIERASITLWQRENVNESFKLVKTVGEVVTTISQLINSAEKSLIFVAHPRFNLISMGGFQNHLRCAVARGVHVRGVLEINQRNALVARAYLSCGVELRHKGHYDGMTMVVVDGKRSISLIYTDLKTALSLDENVAALWSDSIAQAEFLMSAFEMTWTQAINAAEHINQLLQQNPPHKGALKHADKTLSTAG